MIQIRGSDLKHEMFNISDPGFIRSWVQLAQIAQIYSIVIGSSHPGFNYVLNNLCQCMLHGQVAAVALVQVECA